MLATTSGMELIAAEQRYQRRPAEEREYREAAIDFAISFENRPDIMKPAAATFVRETAGEIGEGSNPDRSSALGTGTVLNLTITLIAAAGATLLPILGGVIVGPPGAIAGGLAGLIASESLKKSKPFTSVIAPIIAIFDYAATIDFQKFTKTLLDIEPKVRRLEKYSEQFAWVQGALDWIKLHGGHLVTKDGFRKAIFISYPLQDRFVASNLCNALERAGFACWMAPRDLPDNPKQEDLVSAILSAKCMVVVISDIPISMGVQQEAAIAKNRGIPILFVKIGDARLDHENLGINPIAQFAFVGDEGAAFQQLEEALRKIIQ